MRTANPALSAKTFENLPYAGTGDELMTLEGTVNKTALLFLLLLLAAIWTWNIFFTTNDFSAVLPWMMGGALGGLAVGFLIAFKKEWSAVTAPIYAVLQGLFLGGLSAMMEFKYEGIVIQAVGLTFGTFAMVLFAYKTKIIQATENFKLGVFAATGGIALVYMVSMVLGFFGIHIPFIHDSGLFGIGFSLFVVVIAAMNLVLDFDFIEQGANNNAPKFMEWYSAFGLMVTLIWLYVEILRLLAKLREHK